MKVYYVEPAQGLVRKQANPPDVIPFAKARGYLCESPADFQDTVACAGGGVKVYYLDPSQGLVRKQAHEVLPFPQARGYFCVSPADLKQILDRCTSHGARR